MLRRLIPYLLAIVAFLGLSVADLLRESAPMPATELWLDLLEKLMLVLSMAAVAWAVLTLHDVSAEQTAIRSEMDRARAGGEQWRTARQAEIAALGTAIEAQFRQWGLSPAEIDIAGLLLKGCSMKEIARARATSEVTIRQQAQRLYEKSGLSGRTELSAYFLDSLFGEAEAGRAARLHLVTGDGNPTR